MPSSSLHRLPNGTNQLRRQYRLVTLALPIHRRFSAQTGRGKTPKNLVLMNSKRLYKAIFDILKSQSEGPPASAEAKTRLFEPLPRRKQNHLNEKIQKHAELLRNTLSRKGQTGLFGEQDGWEDLDDLETRRGMSARRNRLIEKKTPQQIVGNHLERVRSTASFRNDVKADVKTKTRGRFIPWNPHRLKRDWDPIDATQTNINQMQTTLQDIEARLQAIDQLLERLNMRKEKRKPSPLLATIQAVVDAPAALRRTLSSLFEQIKTSSDAAVEQPRRTKEQLIKTLLAAGICFAGMRLLGSLHAWDFVPILRDAVMSSPNLHDWIGLIVHTSSLPLLLAATPRTKKMFRRFKQTDFGKYFFHTHQRRSLSKSTPTPGPRKQAAFRDLVNNHPELLDRPFPMTAVLNDLRNLQALRGTSSGREYRVAERRLFRVQHESEVGEGGQLTVRQVTELLEPDDSVGWTTIKQRLLMDRVDAIDSLSKQDRARVMFQRVYGIGATKAERFVQAGFLTLEQLREASLERAQRIGLTHMDDIECLIPRSESEHWRDVLYDVIRSVDAKLGIELLGSFRRGDHYSSDLDFVLFHPDVIDMRIARPDNSSKSDPHPVAAALLDSVVEELRARDLLADELLAHGPLAVKGLVRLSATSKARRIDLNFAPFTRRAFYTLAKTGDTDLMVHLRAKAKARGWALNEYGIGPPNQNGSAWTKNLLPDATHERQIFEFLKVPYLEPEERSFKKYASKLRITRP
ncbi:POLXc domain-containing protein [Pseudozyma hubeiensis]|nr:POLXc domain-containing protein [Pseudozyma hubeiensis]